MRVLLLGVIAFFVALMVTVWVGATVAGPGFVQPPAAHASSSTGAAAATAPR